MTDSTTKKPLQVSNEGTAGPYLELPLSQVDDLKRLLEKHHVYFWVDEDAISLDGEPVVALVEFGQRGDVAAIQRILDSVP